MLGPKGRREMRFCHGDHTKPSRARAPRGLGLLFDGGSMGKLRRLLEAFGKSYVLAKAIRLRLRF